MAYRLIATDVHGNKVMEDVETSKGAAYIGFDIWCDPTLDESGQIVNIYLCDDETGEVILSKKIR